MSPENDRVGEDEMRSEYDLRGGVRGKYYKQYKVGSYKRRDYSSNGD